MSRVLAGHERVLPRTRDKVLTAVTELGYVPSGAARDLAARRTGVLGLCFPDLDTEDTGDGDAAYWHDEVIRGMERAARRSGYAVLIAASHHRDDSGLVLSIAGRCDGLVVLARTAPLAMIEHVATRIPVVLLATEEGGGRPDRAIDYLAVANETGAYQVTAHLTDGHGYAGLCFIAGPPDSPDSARRLDGFRRAAAVSAGRRNGLSSHSSHQQRSVQRGCRVLCRSMSMTLSVSRSWAGSAQPLASLLVPVRCRHAPVTSATRPDAPSRPFLLAPARGGAGEAEGLPAPMRRCAAPASGAALRSKCQTARRRTRSRCRRDG